MSATEEGQDSVNPMHAVAQLAHGRARDGAKFLDEKMPGWAAKISRPVEIQNSFHCIFGQLFGEYCMGTRKFSLKWQQVIDLGFQHFGDPLIKTHELKEHYKNELNRKWEMERRARTG